jgi:hypothetical protein
MAKQIQTNAFETIARTMGVGADFVRQTAYGHVDSWSTGTWQRYCTEAICETDTRTEEHETGRWHHHLPARQLRLAESGVRGWRLGGHGR